MADSLRPVVKMLIHRLEITRGYLLPGYSEADQDAQAAIAFAEAALAAEPPAPAPAIPLDLDALLSPEGAYEPGTGQEDGAQLVDLWWWAPMHGCDTLENLLDRIRRRILPHLRPPIAGIDVPGPDGDYGGLQELCEAEGVDVRIGAPLLKRAREAWGAAQPPAPAPATDGAARLRQCPTHGQQPANAWACPECLRELREELVRLKAPAADGERAAALLRQPAPAPVPGWQPMDTAPQDGTEILASDYDAIEIVSWSWDAWETGSGWIDRNGQRMFPAWWQPLPEQPPIPQSPQGGEVEQ